ncbi:MAG: urease accessory protein UreD [Pseudomonadota bacterium]
MMLKTLPPDVAHQRANGRAFAGLDWRRGRTRLTELAQRGCAKAFLPRVPGAPEVVFLNTAGGLTGGDTLRYALTLGAGSTATATTQTAERAYAATPDAAAAQIDVEAQVGTDAHLDWLPQETILFDRAKLDRSTQIHLSGTASLVFCEALVLGRVAMGEAVRVLHLSDRRMITRDGRPVVLDAVSLSSDTLADRFARAGLADARAVATLGLVAQGAEDAATALRAVALPDGVRCGISGWDGRCLVRLMAEDGWPLRVAMAAIVRHLGTRNGNAGAVPRVWQI